MRTSHRILAAAVFLACSLTCLAQDPQVSVVKGAPFSAQTTTESIQVLADGNRIVRKVTASIARDSEGRTRHDQHLPSTRLVAGKREELSVVIINDPVAGFAYVLDPQSQSARRTASLPAALVSGASGIATAELKSQSLGSQNVEGFQVEGRRITRMVPAGQAGNDRPIEVSVETWYCQELEMILMNKTIDPRTGETLYTVTEIRRAEPDKALFEIPRSFTIRDQTTEPPPEKPNARP